MGIATARWSIISDDLDTHSSPTHPSLTMPDVPLSSSAPRSDSSPAESIKDSPDWTEGGFALVSSDGWRFRVRGAALCWVRYVTDADSY